MHKRLIQNSTLKKYILNKKRPLKDTRMFQIKTELELTLISRRRRPAQVRKYVNQRGETIPQEMCKTSKQKGANKLNSSRLIKPQNVEGFQSSFFVKCHKSIHKMYIKIKHWHVLLNIVKRLIFESKR